MASETPGPSDEELTQQNISEEKKSLDTAQEEKKSLEDKISEEAKDLPEEKKSLEDETSRETRESKQTLEKKPTAAGKPPNEKKTDEETLMESQSIQSLINEFKEYLIKPVTKENILYHYLPLHGVICYTAMSINVMNPSLFSECYPKKDITNFLLFGSVGGITLYASNRPHLQNLSSKERATYSAFGAMMFTFGSVLIWAVMRSVVPESVVVGSAVGILSAASLLKCGISYCNVIDSSAPAPAEEQPAEQPD